MEKRKEKKEKVQSRNKKIKKRSEYVLRLFSEMVSVIIELKMARTYVPGDFSVAITGNVEGKIGSKKISVVVSGIMEGSRNGKDDMNE